MEQSLSSRKVLITGGLGALGNAIVRIVSARGVPCFGTYAAHESPPSQSDSHVQWLGPCDLSRESDVERVFAQVPDLWASVHVAGGFAMSPLTETSAEDFEHMFKMNTLSAMLCTREAAKVMKRSGHGGRIVNVAARPALEPRTGGGMCAYTASKAAVAAFTQAAGEELVGDGILVNAIAPSIINTPANRQAMPDADHDAWPTPEQIAAAVLAMIDPAQSVTRGALVTVYGRS